MSEEAEVTVGEPRASDVAYDQLRDMILDLRLAPAAFVQEQTLAAQLDMGQTLVREGAMREHMAASRRLLQSSF